MGKVRTNQLTPGMIISQEVKDRYGRVLAHSDQRLTRKLIRILKIWGITEIRIKFPATQRAGLAKAAHLPENIREKAEEIITCRFQFNDLSDPFVQELFRISSRKKAHLLWKDSSCSPDNSQAGRAPDHGLPRTRSNRAGINPEQLIENTLQQDSGYSKTITAINNPEASLDDIACIVGKDNTLSSKILQLVNSCFYSSEQNVDSLIWALALIGTNQLMTIASGVSAVSLFKNISSPPLNTISFWKHGIACGIAARLLSGYFPAPIDGECLFVAGLIHDIGRPILVRNRPHIYLNHFQQEAGNKGMLFRAEAETFGLDHSHIGAQLAQHWNLPETLVKMINDHHFPGQDGSQPEISIINLADIIVNALEIGNSGESFVPVLEPTVYQELKLDKEILQPLCKEIENRFETIFDIIYGTSEQ